MEVLEINKFLDVIEVKKEVHNELSDDKNEVGIDLNIINQAEKTIVIEPVFVDVDHQEHSVKTEVSFENDKIEKVKLDPIQNCISGEDESQDSALLFLDRKVAVQAHIMGQKDNMNRFPCDECDYTTKQKNNLLIHKRRHTGEKPFGCENCEKKFSTPSALVRHKQSIHNDNGVKPFCETCGKTFKNIFTVKEHVKNVHDFKGDHYNEEFKLKAIEMAEEIGQAAVVRELKITPTTLHAWINHEKNPLECDTCGVTFSKTVKLRKHVKESHEIVVETKLQRVESYSKDYKYKAVQMAEIIGVAEAADKLGIYYSTLKAWVNINKNPSFTCAVCGKNFSRGSHLKAHMDGVHGKSNVPRTRQRYQKHDKAFQEEVTDYAIKHGVAEAAKKYGQVSLSTLKKWVYLRTDPVKCEQCGDAFAYQKALAKHIKVRHDGVPYARNRGLWSWSEKRKENQFSDCVVMHDIPEEVENNLEESTGVESIKSEQVSHKEEEDGFIENSLPEISEVKMEYES
eukprot:GFUD01018779.1.p1 GENE.GFUD01018779.1~~GFUD01018779.1.p1  ORF type:complete len:512 (+),score=95.32 GFUD01018779.1:60-1595(+)